MDLQIYREIMELRGEDSRAKKKGEKFGVDAAVIGFRKDLCSGKVVWVNDYWQDFLIYIKCYHPLVSIFTVPDEHPYSSKERIFVLICVTVLSCLFGYLAALPGNNKAGSYAISIIGGIFIGIIGGILKVLATCSCAQGCHPICRRCWETIGQCGMCIWGIITIVLFIIVIILVVQLDNPGKFIISFFLSLISSWITAFIKLLIMFSFYFRKQILIILSKQTYFICFQDYLDYINKVPLSRELVRKDRKKNDSNNNNTKEENIDTKDTELTIQPTQEELQPTQDNNEYAIPSPLQQQQQEQVPVVVDNVDQYALPVENNNNNSTGNEYAIPVENQQQPVVQMEYDHLCQKVLFKMY
jgi:hypothetical protein